MARSNARHRQHVILCTDGNKLGLRADGSCSDLLSATDVLLATDGQLHAADMLSHGLSAGAGYDLLPDVDVRSVHRLSAHCDEAGHVIRHAG